jgi:adenosylcobinamide kinase/adenosylcobinamide-phosphate guanylyltransferase
MPTLIIGGARSGKSRYAQQLALQLSTRPVYLATARAWDADFAVRIDRHRRDRGPEWRTIEEERRLALPELQGQVVVVDCITLWLANRCVDPDLEVDQVLERATTELDRALLQATEWIFVANELGMSIHPPTEAGRRFVDLQGFINQHLAARADAVCLMVAGIPHFVKGAAPCRK